MASDTFLTLGFFGFIGARAARKPAGKPPPTSLFQLAVLVSTLGQAVISLLVMRTGTELAKEAMGPVALQQLLAFQRKVDDMPILGVFDLRSKVMEKMAAGAGPLEIMMATSRPFQPNPLNSVVFLVEVAQR